MRSFGTPPGAHSERPNFEALATSVEMEKLYAEIGATDPKAIAHARKAFGL